MNLSNLTHLVYVAGPLTSVFEYIPFLHKLLGLQQKPVRKYGALKLVFK